MVILRLICLHTIQKGTFLQPPLKIYRGYLMLIIFWHIIPSITMTFFAVSLLQPDQVSREKYLLMQCNPLHPLKNQCIERWMERKGKGGGEKRTIMVSTVQHLLINHSSAAKWQQQGAQ